MHALVLVVLLASPEPPLASAVRVAFVRGDLNKAEQLARVGARAHDAECQQQLRWLAEYARLAAQFDWFTRRQAHDFLELDRHLSPTQPGAVTRPILEHFVLQPLVLARGHFRQGRILDAWYVVSLVLDVDPTNAQAQHFFETEGQFR